MIYLIDDSLDKNCGVGYLLQKSYQDIVTIVSDEAQLNEIKDKLPAAECILVHRTFCDSNLAAADMDELTAGGEFIRLVVFSEGDLAIAKFVESTALAIDSIKKSVMYTRMIDFLNDYQQNHLVNLHILANGKDYIKVKVRTLSINILHAIALNVGIVKKETVLDSIGSDLKKLIEYASPQLNIDYDGLLTKIEDNHTTFESIRTNIINIATSFAQYGKNIYTWK